MQYFKLTQDTPQHAAGTVFYRESEADDLTAINDEADKIAIDKIADFDKFFKQVEPAPSRYFKPQVGEAYYYMADDGSAKRTTNAATTADAARIALGNAFKRRSDLLAYKRSLEARAAIVSHPANQYQPDWANAYETITPELAEQPEGSPHLAPEIVPRVVAYAIAQDKTTGGLVVVPITGATTYHPIAYYETEAEAEAARTAQAAEYQAYMRGL